MSPEEQRIAIAHACGWTDIRWTGNRYVGSTKEYGSPQELPDFCDDLNAMHEAEKALDENQQLVYGSRLYEITGAYNQETQRREGWKEIHSTAAQRAEAFLKTMNLWKE